VEEDQRHLEETIKGWLRSTIWQLEQHRATQSTNW
jgi:hypothetical protein